MELVKYEAACRAVAAAKSIDEVKEISNRAAAARAYARQAKNKQLELDALEIRTRAERRLGEMIISLQNDGHCVQGGRGDDIIRLRELDIDGNLSQPAQRLARIPATEFESELLNWRSASEASRRIEVPLQRYRHPSKKGDVQRAYAKIARQIPGEQDELRRFKGPDGRLMRDWRLGELKRIESECLRGAAAAQKLMGECPVANADPRRRCAEVAEGRGVSRVFQRMAPMLRGMKLLTETPMFRRSPATARTMRAGSICRSD
jgi:hypothetical protein